MSSASSWVSCGSVFGGVDFFLLQPATRASRATRQAAIAWRREEGDMFGGPQGFVGKRSGALGSLLRVLHPPGAGKLDVRRSGLRSRVLTDQATGDRDAAVAA